MGKGPGRYQELASNFWRQTIVLFMLACVCASIAPELVFESDAFVFVGEWEEEKHEDTEKESEFEDEALLNKAFIHSIVSINSKTREVFIEETQPSFGREILAPPPDKKG